MCLYLILSLSKDLGQKNWLWDLQGQCLPLHKAESLQSCGYPFSPMWMWVLDTVLMTHDKFHMCILHSTLGKIMSPTWRSSITQSSPALIPWLSETRCSGGTHHWNGPLQLLQNASPVALWWTGDWRDLEVIHTSSTKMLWGKTIHYCDRN